MHYMQIYASYAKKNGQGLTETSFPKSRILSLEFADLVAVVGLRTILNGSAKTLKKRMCSINRLIVIIREHKLPQQNCKYFVNQRWQKALHW